MNQNSFFCVIFLLNVPYVDLCTMALKCAVCALILSMKNAIKIRTDCEYKIENCFLKLINFLVIANKD